MTAASHGTTPYYFVPGPSSHPVMAAKEWPVVFVIDPKIPKDVTNITLSYTFFEVGGKTPAAPKTAALGHGVLTGNAPS